MYSSIVSCYRNFCLLEKQPLPGWVSTSTVLSVKTRLLWEKTVQVAAHTMGPNCQKFESFCQAVKHTSRSCSETRPKILIKSSNLLRSSNSFLLPFFDLDLLISPHEKQRAGPKRRTSAMYIFVKIQLESHQHKVGLHGNHCVPSPRF